MKNILVMLLGLAFLSWAGSTPKIIGGQSFLGFALESYFSRPVDQAKTQDKFADKQLKVLIVPGHNNYSPGAVYKNIREADLTVSLAFKLKALLENQGVYVLVTRDENGEYSRWFTDFIQTEKEYINEFRNNARKIFQEKKDSGAVTDFLGGVGHNYASSEANLYLYAVNAYANMNNYDLVIHPHFNDEAKRKKNKIGKYEGFAVYIPEVQLPNAGASKDLGEDIKTELGKKFKTSTLPKERGGLIESQDLIAIGSNGSRSGVSVLVEYGYIYENLIRTEKTRESFLNDAAIQTFNGIMDYLTPEDEGSLSQ